MFQSMSSILNGQFAVTRDGNVIGIGQPEPEFMQRRYAHAEALREMKRDEKIRQILANESRGFVERIRFAFGLA